MIPVNAICLSGTLISVCQGKTIPDNFFLTNQLQLYGLIFLGSTTAFSAMVAAAIVFLQTSCVVPQAILLYRGRDILPTRYFSLGRCGKAINAIAVSWVLFLDIIYCFPTTMPVTVENMNYVSVVSVGLTAFVLILWFASQAGNFTSPKINIQQLEERRIAALGIGILSVTEGLEKTMSQNQMELESVAGAVKA